MKTLPSVPQVLRCANLRFSGSGSGNNFLCTRRITALDLLVRSNMSSCGIPKQRRRQKKGEHKWLRRRQDGVSHRRFAEKVSATQKRRGQIAGGSSARILARPYELEAREKRPGTHGHKTRSKENRPGNGHGLGSQRTHVAVAFLDELGKILPQTSHEKCCRGSTDVPNVPGQSGVRDEGSQAQRAESEGLAARCRRWPTWRCGRTPLSLHVAATFKTDPFCDLQIQVQSKNSM